MKKFKYRKHVFVLMLGLLVASVLPVLPVKAEHVALSTEEVERRIDATQCDEDCYEAPDVMGCVSGCQRNREDGNVECCNCETLLAMAQIPGNNGVASIRKAYLLREKWSRSISGRAMIALYYDVGLGYALSDDTVGNPTVQNAVMKSLNVLSKLYGV